MPKGIGALRDPKEILAPPSLQVRPPQELNEDRREKRGQRVAQALVTLETKVIVGFQDLLGLQELLVLQLKWYGWETVLSYSRCQALRGPLGFQVWMGLQGPQVQMENREIQEKMAKLANQVLEGLLEVRAAQEPKARRESVERASQGQGAPQDYLVLQDPAVEIVLHSWTWRDLDLQTWTNSGDPVVLQAPLGLLGVLELQ